MPPAATADPFPNAPPPSKMSAILQSIGAHFGEPYTEPPVTHAVVSACMDAMHLPKSTETGLSSAARAHVWRDVVMDVVSARPFWVELVDLRSVWSFYRRALAAVVLATGRGGDPVAIVTMLAALVYVAGLAAAAFGGHRGARARLSAFWHYHTNVSCMWMLTVAFWVTVAAALVALMPGGMFRFNPLEHRKLVADIYKGFAVVVMAATAATSVTLTHFFITTNPGPMFNARPHPIEFAYFALLPVAINMFVFVVAAMLRGRKRKASIRASNKHAHKS